MFSLFETRPVAFRLDVALGKKHTIVLKLYDFNKKKQYGGDIICLKFAWLDRTIKDINQNYNVLETNYYTGETNGKKRING